MSLLDVYQYTKQLQCVCVCVCGYHIQQTMLCFDNAFL